MLDPDEIDSKGLPLTCRSMFIIGPDKYDLKIITISITPPLWTDLVKISSRKPRHASSFSFECTDFKNVIFENIHWAHSEDAEVAEVKRPRNPK